MPPVSKASGLKPRPPSVARSYTSCQTTLRNNYLRGNRNTQVSGSKALYLCRYIELCSSQYIDAQCPSNIHATAMAVVSSKQATITFFEFREQSQKLHTRRHSALFTGNGGLRRKATAAHGCGRCQPPNPRGIDRRRRMQRPPIAGDRQTLRMLHAPPSSNWGPTNSVQLFPPSPWRTSTSGRPKCSSNRCVLVGSRFVRPAGPTRNAC